MGVGVVGAVGFSLNEHGVIVSDHVCNACGEPFTVTPAKGDQEWGGCCLSVDCPSYDPARDADRFFEDG